MSNWNVYFSLYTARQFSHRKKYYLVGSVFWSLWKVKRSFWQVAVYGKASSLKGFWAFSEGGRTRLCRVLGPSARRPASWTLGKEGNFGRRNTTCGLDTCASDAQSTNSYGHERSFAPLPFPPIASSRKRTASVPQPRWLTPGRAPGPAVHPGEVAGCVWAQGQEGTGAPAETPRSRLRGAEGTRRDAAPPPPGAALSLRRAGGGQRGPLPTRWQQAAREGPAAPRGRRCEGKALPSRPPPACPGREVTDPGPLLLQGGSARQPRPGLTGARVRARLPQPWGGEVWGRRGSGTAASTQRRH